MNQHDRRELGEAIASRFDGAVTYYDRAKNGRGGKNGRRQFRSTAVLDLTRLTTMTPRKP